MVKEGTLEWREKPDPRLEARTEAIVRPRAASTCDVDRDPGRREIASSSGAEVVAEIEPIFEGFEIAVDATSGPQMLATACRSLVLPELRSKPVFVREPLTAPSA